ncbi:receptor-like protein 12-like [Dorcoceras hygrometricum]|uniref:Receptor-like protein 12-like n=1 Tax=Dorcoceras hygrometricum TaxID=472368 RepID=A0A2Z7C0J6_9LAMI|nr:receptor-like protein 12-like [Dorcoceras hygrometricum]
MRITLLPWILLVFFFRILSVSWVFGQCLSDQRSLLLQLNSSLVYNSANSRKLVNWNQNVDCCKWDGVACDSTGHVTSLELHNESISSGIEDSTLFRFRYLERLNLALNRFNNSEIPKGLQNLTNLAFLNLSNAGFGGQIPVELSTLRSLVSLDLSTLFPDFVHPLTLENPNFMMLVQNLTSLMELNLDGVRISDPPSDWFPSISSSLPNLRNLSLRNCGLSGPLDSLSQLPALSVLRLDRNNLSSTVPNSFTKFSNLTTLSLSSCSLYGSFPQIIFLLPTLQNLDLSNNLLLEGTIPEFHQIGSFRTIILTYTNFSGSLPDFIGNLRMLSMIKLSHCNFTGPIPATITNLRELVSVDFSFNSFTGSIPTFQMSKKLSYIDLSYNKLVGPISSRHFEGLTNLTFINLGFNALSGSIPSSLFSLPSLQKLQLSNNQFSGQVQEFFTVNSSNLDTLELSSNMLEGPIPMSFFNLEKLNVLLLSFNSFSGTIRLDIIQTLPNLARLELGYNNLSVEVGATNSSLSRLNLASCKLNNFPDVRNQTKLIFLDLSNNNISGDIPSWVWEIGDGQLNHLNLSYNILVGLQMPYNMPSKLVMLDLHSNQLQGQFPSPPKSVIYVDYSNNNFQEPIPHDIGNFIPLASFLSLANNMIAGPIPASLCNLSDLQVLDLSGNLLSGSIPPCLLRNSRSLGVLNLGKNSISGDIPDSFPVSCGLKTLDLSRNNLEGRIPASLANCISLEVLNVGSNNIYDGFPCMLQNSSSLRVLVLRSNRFHGGITCPEVNQSWPNLQIIDIAFNNFVEYLNSSCFSSWKRMMQESDGPGHISFNYLVLANLYYQDTVTVTIKGLELQLVKILTIFTSIDFSFNNFQGVIPEAVGQLRSLYVLNLSHNSLTGTIPKSIGNLTSLGSLDLSRNQLTGMIPGELASLTFLSFLNLSYNKLFGRIPLGFQLQTFSEASYIGNAGLCGFPLNITCEDPPAAEVLHNSILREFDWQFILTGLGYGVGAALIIAPIAFCKQWRDQCNEHMDAYLGLIFPRYAFSYVRYEGKFEELQDVEDETSDDKEDDLSRGRYCIFCTKFDIQIAHVVHNIKCTCHSLPPTFSSYSTSSSSSSSVLFMYGRKF